jgi:Na+:H+ antiporter, NhaA family
VTSSVTAGRQREFVAQFAAPLRNYLRTETGSAALLLAATVFALVWANSPLGDLYADLWHTEVGIEVGSYSHSEDLRHWVNDGLMVFFFFVIGLELRRQLTMGELTDRRRITIPVIAAIAGLAVPAVIYLAFNPSGEAARGWGVAMATDTAFVLGALAIVGPRFPTQLRVFMLSLSVVDDIGALAAIAIFYTDTLALGWLGVAVACLVAILLLEKLRVWRGPAYFAVGAVMWLALVESGVHPTLGGVALGLLISVYPPRPEEVAEAGVLARAFGQSPLPELARSAKLSVERAISPNERLQELLHPWTSFFVVPVFAVANAGVVIDSELVDRAISSPVTHGIVAALVGGKLLGIALASTGAVRIGLGRLPGGIRWGELWGGAALSGIGFTVSLFVVDLAFSDAELQDEARLGVLSASLLAALVGTAIFRLDRALSDEGHNAPVMALDEPVSAERDHVRGRLDAPLELVEYGDYECPFCGRATGAVDLLRERFGDELRYVFRHLPQPEVHPRAELAAEAAEAAAAQGAFWEMHDRLYAHQDELDPADLVDHADALGLDLERFARDLGTGEHAGRVRRDVASAQASGAEGTPTFFVNGTRVTGRYDAKALAALLTGTTPAPAPAEPEPAPAGDPAAVAGLPAMGRLRGGMTREAAPLELDDLVESPDEHGALPRLSEQQIGVLERFGERRRVAAGEPLFGAGEPGADFVVVLSGMVAMVDGYGEDNTVRMVHCEGRFLGELGILRGQATLLTAVAARDGEVLIVPTDRLREALDADRPLRDLVLRSYLLRRAVMLDIAAELRIVGSGQAPDTQRLRGYLTRENIVHSFIDLDTDERAAGVLEDLGIEPGETPVAVTRSRLVLRNPSDDELGRALGLNA